MYKTINECPTAEQIARFGMKENHEDMLTDYRIDLSGLSEEKKRELCDLYGIDPEALAGKEKLTLSLLSRV